MSIYYDGKSLLTGNMLTDEQKRHLISFRRALRKGQPVDVQWCLCFDIATPPSFSTLKYINGTGWPVEKGNVEVFRGGEINIENDSTSRRFSFYYRENRFSSGCVGRLDIGNWLSVLITYPQKAEVVRQQISEHVAVDVPKSLGITARIPGATWKECSAVVYRSLLPDKGWKWNVSYQPRGCNIVVAAWEYEIKSLSHLCLFLFSQRDWERFSKEIGAGRGRTNSCDRNQEGK